MIGKKVGGMRVVRIGPFTFMFCKRKASNEQRREAALLKRAKRASLRAQARIGCRYIHDMRRGVLQYVAPAE